MDEELRRLERLAREGDLGAQLRLRASQSRRPIPCPFCDYTEKRLEKPARIECRLVHRGVENVFSIIRAVPVQESRFLARDLEWTRADLREAQRREFPCSLCKGEWEFSPPPPRHPAHG